MRGFNHKKAVQALNFLAIKSGGQSNKMKAIKLIWLADRFHLRNHGRTITGDVYFAMEHGPVPSSTRDILEKSSFLPTADETAEYTSSFIEIIDRYFYKSICSLNEKVFSKSDLNALQIIFDNYGNLGKYELRDLSHDFPEWKRFQSALESISTSFQMEFDDFFINVNDGRSVFVDDEERINTVKDMFFESKMLSSI